MERKRIKKLSKIIGGKIYTIRPSLKYSRKLRKSKRKDRRPKK